MDIQRRRSDIDALFEGDRKQLLLYSDTDRLVAAYRREEEPEAWSSHSCR